VTAIINNKFCLTGYKGQWHWISRYHQQYKYDDQG